MQIDAFERLAARLAERIPDPLLQDLNGGIIVAEEAHRRDDDPQGVYILGEYITDPHLGAYIVLYYGSFRQLFGDDRRLIEAELWETLRHEIRHHIEERAGVDDLDIEDMVQLAELRRLAAEGELAAPLRLRPVRGWQGRDHYRPPR